MADLDHISTDTSVRKFSSPTNLYYYRARYYDPNSGKFLNEDPNDQGSQYDNPNLYEYVENNPANWIDPLGLYTLDPHQKIPPLPPSPGAAYAGFACAGLQSTSRGELHFSARFLGRDEIISLRSGGARWRPPLKA